MRGAMCFMARSVGNGHFDMCRTRDGFRAGSIAMMWGRAGEGSGTKQCGVSERFAAFAVRPPVSYEAHTERTVG